VCAEVVNAGNIGLTGTSSLRFMKDLIKGVWSPITDRDSPTTSMTAILFISIFLAVRLTTAIPLRSMFVMGFAEREAIHSRYTSRLRYETIMCFFYATQEPRARHTV